LKALVADVPHFAAIGALPLHADTRASTWEGIGLAGPLDTMLPLGHAIADYYLTNPVARASETMALCSREFVTPSKLAAE
jgi:NADH-quinone oxidoreductase subunit G